MKVWITKDKQADSIWRLVSIFDKAPPIHVLKAFPMNGVWIASKRGRCIAASVDQDFIADLGIDLQPGECREAEIEIKLIDAK